MSTRHATPSEALPSYRLVFVVALVVIASLTAAFGGWGMFARLDSAVVTHGTLLAESQRKTVEHLEGGILRELLVKAGDRVEEGQVVARLDATQTEAQLAQLRADELTLTYEIWRLEAEDAGAAHLDPATAPAEPVEGREARIAAEARLFDARRRAHEGQVAALAHQVEQLAAELDAAGVRERSAERQLASWRDERARTALLVDKGAAPSQKLLELDRNLAAAEGERDGARSAAAGARERIAATRVESETLRQQRLAEVGERLTEDRRRLSETASRIRAALDVLARRELRAPQAGRVVQISTVTPGAVIASGAAVMEIVPDDDPLVVETRLPPEAIDTVHVGRPARVKLTAYKRALAPTITGEVSYVSADLLEDERDGTTYFKARVTVDPAEVEALGGVTLSPGMPVEVAIRTGERRAGEYLVEPFLRHATRALREE